MSDVLTAIAMVLGAAGTLISVVLGFLLKARMASGRVDTTAASELWARMVEQLDKFREELNEKTEQLDKFREELNDKDILVAGLRAKVGELLDDRRKRDDKINQLERQVSDLRQELAAKDARIAHLEEELRARLDAAARAVTEKPS